VALEGQGSMGGTEDGEVNEGLTPVLARPPIPQYLADVWARREFIVTVPVNQLRASNMDTLLGNFWFLVNPALQTLVYFLIFGVMLKIDRGIDNYLSFLVIGVLTFTFFTTAMTAAARCMQANLTLIRSMYFPRAAIPISSLLANLYTFLPSLLIMVVLVLLTGGGLTWRWAVLPPILALIFVMALGIVFIIARVGKAVPDLHALLPHVLRLLFYGSGVLFAPARFTSNEAVLWIFYANPLYEVLVLTRWSLLGRPMEWFIPWMAVGWASAIVMFGAWFFWRGETSYGNA
jgi:teichoic acid transport system permease protein